METGLGESNGIAFALKPFSTYEYHQHGDLQGDQIDEV
jgi:hypothetical protein